jgi:superfamily II DNA or RNA helicase
MTEPKKISEVIQKLKEKYPASILDKGVKIFVPFPEMVSLSSIPNLSQPIQEFIHKYEPKITENGLYPHQAEAFREFEKDKKNFVLTTSTGSGKSLVFWSWVVNELSKYKNTTAILCFPTQALMWGQAERIARASDLNTLVRHKELPFGGTLGFTNHPIKWTVWKGTGWGHNVDKWMKIHEKTDHFEESRIRICTLDKVHYSLIKDHKKFTKNLMCIVLDEAHIYDGVFGANVSYLLKRIYTTKASQYLSIPNVFLASATLSDVESFSSKLTGLESKKFTYIFDKFKPEIQVKKLDELIQVAENPPVDGLMRISIFNDQLKGSIELSDEIQSKEKFGKDLNILYFSFSKFKSRLIYEQSRSKQNHRENIIYDGDLPIERRREIERTFGQGTKKGINLLSTNALELGVDIENLDICSIEEIPMKRADFLQRVGRVGRKIQKPGLLIVKLSSEPFDRAISHDLETAFNPENAKSIPIPLDLELIKLKAMSAFYQDISSRSNSKNKYDYYNNNPEKLIKSFKEYFGIYYDEAALNNLKEKHRSLIDNGDMSWVHSGFRATASKGKIPLLNQSEEIVALIEDINIFRDAHPDAIYLDNFARKWKVIDYLSEWRVAKLKYHDIDTILGKYLKSITAIRVERINENIVTRGIYEVKSTLDHGYEIEDKEAKVPSQNFHFGIWDYTRKFNGYKCIDLGRKTSSIVPLTEVTQKFKQAIEYKQNFPFLFPLSYKTYGWEWKFEDHFKNIEEQTLENMGDVLEIALHSYFCDTIQCSHRDILVNFDLKQKSLQVLDASPGGNGLSEALLFENRFSIAIENLINILQSFKSKSVDEFKKWIVDLTHKEPVVVNTDLIGVLRELKSLW